jgi:hypothetical protein
MFIDANEITVLIQAAKDMMEKLPEDQQYIHARDIAATLQKLIDDEDECLDQMAKDWEDREAGRIEMEDAHHEKLIEQDMARYEWPGGI